MGEAAPAPPAGCVLLVEDDPAVRGSLALLLQLHGYSTVEFDSAEAFLAAPPPRERPACALVDIRLPGMSGLALQARMGRDHRGPPVLLMTAQGDEAVARTALLQGAVDFLEKPIEETVLLDAVAQGMRSDAERLARESERDAVLSRLRNLTRREVALFESITDGRQVREIAEQFGVTVDDLTQQRAQLMEKLQAPRVMDLFRLRFKVGELLAGRDPAL